MRTPSVIHIRRLTFTLAYAATLMAPRAAYACAYSWVDNFAPSPACKQHDKPALQRLTQLNLKIAGKLATISAKSAMVAEEIRGWTEAASQAERFESKLRAMTGEITADPLPSLSAAFDETGMPLQVSVGPDGRMTLAAKFIDVRSMVNSVLSATFLDTLGLRHMYSDALGAKAFATSEKYTKSRWFQTQLRDLEDYRLGVKPLRDSLKSFGKRNADRYATGPGVSKDGLSEAQISFMVSQMTQLTGASDVAAERSRNAAIQGTQILQTAEAERRKRKAMSAYSGF